MAEKITRRQRAYSEACERRRPIRLASGIWWAPSRHTVATSYIRLRARQRCRCGSPPDRRSPDIKPENILLHDGGALVADFGIALALQHAEGDRLTGTGTSVGTPKYMSPEQAYARSNVDARSDIYSLGVVLYEMLAGEPPFTGPTAPSIVAKLLVERPTRLRVVRSAVPAAIDAAVARALEKAPADRFPSSQDFVRALHRAPVVPRVGRAQVRRWGVALLAAALLLTVGIRWNRTASRDDQLPRPEATQLTYTGNADVPALSPDGSRVAYVARECAATGVCTSTIMISDTSGSASLPVVRGRGLIDDLEWTSDDRMLLFSELTGGTSHSFAVSTLGGQPRALGNGYACQLDGVDTALVLDRFDPGSDSVSWLRLVTLADGVTRDSIPLPVRGLDETCLGSPDGRRLATVSLSDSLWTLHLLDREGRQLDSLSHGSWQYFTIRWTPSGDALLVTNGRGERDPAPSTCSDIR